MGKHETYLQHLHKHVDNIPDGVLCPMSICCPHGFSNLGKYTKNYVFELKLCKHGECVVVAIEADLPYGNPPEDFEMFVPFISYDNYADNNIMPISCTGSSRKGILSVTLASD